MAWSNQTGDWFGYDMDSANPGVNQDRKLIVRNHQATASGQYRAEILETSGSEQALRVKGLAYLERVNNAQPDQAFALTVKGKTTMSRWDTEHRPQPILVVDGRTDLQAYGDEPGQHSEYALKVTGRSFFARLDADDPMAVKVDGNIRLRLNETGGQDNTCGVLSPFLGIVIDRPDITDIPQNQVLINGNKDDRPNPQTNDEPHVKIGWQDVEDNVLRGNVVAIRPRKLLLGTAPFVLGDNDIYGIKAKASARIEPTNEQNVALHVIGKIWTHKLDSDETTATLKIGQQNATAVHIGDLAHSVNTVCNGQLNVRQMLTAEDHVVVSGRVSAGAGFEGDGSVTAYMRDQALQVRGAGDEPGHIDATGNALIGGNLTLGGNVQNDLRIDGDLSVGGNVLNDLRINGDLSVAGNVQNDLRVDGEVKCAGGNCQIGTSEGARLDLKTRIKQGGANDPTLHVEHTSVNSTQPVLNVAAHTMNLQSVGIKVNAATALYATGKVDIVGQTKLAGNTNITGTTTHDAAVKMQGNDLNMGGSGAGEVLLRYANNRLEIFVGGTLRFYVDSTGGHNA